MDEIIIKYIKEELNRDRKEFELNAEEDLLGSGLVESVSMLQLIQLPRNLSALTPHTSSYQSSQCLVL